MKILLVGSSGFIGKSLFDDLIGHYGFESVYLFKRHGNTHLKRNEITYSDLIEYNFDVVINCSGVYTNNKIKSNAINYEYLVSFFTHLRVHSKLFVIHTSSYGIYNGNFDDEISFMTPAKPLNNYEISKLKAHKFIEKLTCRKCILIPTNVYSVVHRKVAFARYFSFLGFSINTADIKVLNSEIISIIENKENLSDTYIRFVNETYEYKKTRFIKGKKLIHKFFAKFFKILVPHFLFFFDYRKFNM